MALVLWGFDRRDWQLPPGCSPTLSIAHHADEVAAGDRSDDRLDIGERCAEEARHRRRQFKRLRAVLKRQCTFLGRLLREVRRKMGDMADEARAGPEMWVQRAERVHSQRPKDRNKLYALHSPEAECIGKGKARQPYEFGVKVSLAVTHQHGLMVGARSFPGNPYDGHTLAAQIEQTTNLLQDIGVKPTTAIVDLGYRGVDKELAPVEVIHRGKFKSLSPKQRIWLKRRQAIEPLIGHTKADHRMDRCWLKGARGDALHAVLCAAGFNVRWLLRAVARLGLGGLLLVLTALARYAAVMSDLYRDLSSGAGTESAP